MSGVSAGVGMHHGSELIEDLRRDEWLVALQVDDQICIDILHCFSDAIGAAHMIDGSHDWSAAELADTAGYALVVGGDNDFVRAGLIGLFADPLDHGAPCDGRKNLGRESGACATRGDDDSEFNNY